MGSITEEQQVALMGRTLKEGERILAPTRRPDGTLRKPIRIRAGYVPQDEVAIYQSKGSLLKKNSVQEVPPGYDPVLDAKPKTKAAKRNERKKEKKQQAALEKGKDLNEEASGEVDLGEGVGSRLEAAEAIEHQMNNLAVSETPTAIDSSAHSTEIPNSGDPALDLDKKIRALKKKIRLTEALQKTEQDNLKPEQLDKLAKLEGLLEELKLMEEKKNALGS
ncbi:partner of Y14 and mago isoform X2 [Aristolochia californica]|uniref:partner of Y14 and mago isoform X2 n=1 Tax=Aristolochia californica TaxID=171875 RepID=UPI0035E2B416